MAKLGSKQNPLVLNVHEDALAQEIVEVCTREGWHFILGMNPTEPTDLMDLIHKLEPPTLEYERPKVQRNEPCPCGSGHKYKKCCLAQEERAQHANP